MKSYKLSKPERPKDTLPAKWPKELSTKNYMRRSATTRPDQVKIIIRKSDEEPKTGPNNLKSAEWDLIPTLWRQIRSLLFRVILELTQTFASL